MDGNAFEDRLLTVREIARYLAMAPGTIRNRVSAGTIPFVKLPGGQVRFRRADIDAWVASGQENGDAQPAA